MGSSRRTTELRSLDNGCIVTDSHWVAWHRPYDDPDSRLSARLAVVQSHIAQALTRCDPGPIRVVSVCAGQGRDLIEILVDHPRRPDVTARLVEADAALVDFAARSVSAAGLFGVEVVMGDASVARAYGGAVPADLVLVCGVFGNISDADIQATIGHLPGLCAPGATVIWTRHRREPDRTPQIREWFTDGGFAEIGFDAPAGFVFGVGSNQLTAEPKPFDPGVRLFTFVGDGTLPA
jgi:hypothetical protein